MHRNLVGTANEFVKLTDVKETVSQLLFPLINKMKTREREYSRITTQFAVMKGELMKHNTETKMALRLKKTVTD